MNTPNKLTLTRVLLVPLFVALYYWDIPLHYLLATIIFLTAAVTDAIDGWIGVFFAMISCKQFIRRWKLIQRQLSLAARQKIVLDKTIAVRTVGKL